MFPVLSGEAVATVLEATATQTEHRVRQSGRRQIRLPSKQGASLC